MNKDTNCKLCKASDTFDFFELPPTPTQDGNMASTREEALEMPKGRIQLRYCNNCGYIRNEAYDSSKITFDAYDFSNDHSPLFKNYVNTLTNRLIEKYHLTNKTILDIGCGDGYFLKQICERGNNKGIGIDAGFDFSKHKTETPNIEFIQDYYSEKYNYWQPNFIACRLVIDLLDKPSEFLKMIRQTIDFNPDVILYVEVPNAVYTFKNKIIWNVVYEHSSWYIKESLNYQFESCGFEVLDIATCWKDEFLGIEVRSLPKVNSPRKSSISLEDLSSFQNDFEHIKEQSLLKIQQIKEKKIKCIAWGAGARAVSFFNIFDLSKEVNYIVDINSNRHGKYLPGTGQCIVAPEFITSFQPDLVIITNPTYAGEIKKHIYELGLNPRFWVLSHSEL